MPKEYIEREAAIEELKRRDFLPVIVKHAIEAVPAADVAPVVHAKWDANGRCTNCGGHAPFYNFYSMASTYYETPYCFECGARMDKEEE